MNVHEGPHGISFRESSLEVGLEAGMTVTNEPGKNSMKSLYLLGYYEDGAFGIRIENVMIVKEVATKHKFGGKPYLGFEHVTFVPIDTKLIAKEMLTVEEVEWLNHYHRECLKKVGALMDPNESGFHWLKKQCQPI